MKTLNNLLTFFIIFSSTNIFSQNHPRLLIDASDIPIIKAKITNPQNVTTYQLYQEFLSVVLPYVNATTVPSDPIYYGFYSNVAFASLFHDDPNIANQWKDNMVYLAINKFTMNFGSPGNTGDLFRPNVFAIASSLIYDYCYDRLDQNEKDILIARIKQSMDHMSDFVLVPNNEYGGRYRNTHGHISVGYIIGAIAIGGDSPIYTIEQRDTDLSRIKHFLFGDEPGNENPNSYFQYIFGDNGSYQEEVNYSSNNVLRVVLALQALSKFEGIDYYEKPVVSNALSKSSKWLASSLLTNRQPRSFVFNALNKCPAPNIALGNYSTWLIFAEKYQDGTFRWIFDQAVGSPSYINSLTNWPFPETFIPTLIAYNEFPPTSPNIEELKTYVDCDRGLLYWRTGWEYDDMMFSIESTPAYHDDIVYVKGSQSDKGNITLTAYGNNFIFDRGGFSLIDQRTEGNNYINVNDKGENNYEWWITDGKIEDLKEYNFYCSVKTINTNAFNRLYEPAIILNIYDENNLPPQQAIFNPVLNAERNVFYLKRTPSIPYYFWVIDEIQKDDQVSFEYDWHIHTRTINTINDAANPIKIYRNGYPATLDIFVIRPTTYSTVVSFVPGNDNPLEEILEPEVEVLGTPTNKLQILHNSVDGQFNILLVPYTTGIPTPAYTNLQMNSGEGVKILWSTNYEDHCFYSSTNNITSGIINSDSKQVFARKNLFDKYSQFFALDGSQTTFNGNELVYLNGQSGDVIYDSLNLKIYGNSITQAKIYAPYAVNVELNDQPVNFSRVNDHIYIGNFSLTGYLNIERDLFITSEATLTINAGTYLNFLNNSSLLVNGSLNIQGSSSSKVNIDFQTPQNDNGIIVYSSGSIVISHCIIRDGRAGIRAETNNLVNIQNCDFINCTGNAISIISVQQNGEQVPSLPRVKYCTIINSDYGIVGANLNEIEISYNEINDTKLGIYLSNVATPQIILNNIISGSYQGIFLESCGGFIRRNYITGHSNGIHLGNSSPDIGNNTIDDNVNRGIYVGEGSIPNLEGSLVRDPIHNVWYGLSGYNIIMNNGGWSFDDDGSEIFLYNSGILMKGGCNEVTDQRIPDVENTPPLYNTRLLINSGGDDGVIEINAEENFWEEHPLYHLEERFGENLIVYYEPALSEPCPQPDGSEEKLYVKSSSGETVDTLYAIEISPTLTQTEQLYALAEGKFLTADFNGAETIYNQIVNGNDSTQVKLKAYKRLYEIGKLTNKSGAYFNNLYTSFSSIIQSTDNLFLKKIFSQLSSLSLIGQQEYVPAINEFDNIVQQNPNTEEAFYAEIDILTTSLLADTGNGQLGKIGNEKYLVKGSSDYMNKLNTLMKKQFGVEGKGKKDKIIPTEYSLFQNFPNPFNPSTSITFDLPETEMVEIKIYDILGREITTLINEIKTAGRHTISFNAGNLSSGIYFYKIKTNSFNKTKKMILLR